MHREVKVLAVLLGAAITVYAAGAFTVATVLDGDEPVIVGNVEADVDHGGPGSLAFEDVTDEAGVEYASTRQSYLDASQELMSASGVYVTDRDGDGWSDVLLLGGDRAAFYENRGGTFVEIDVLPEGADRARTALFFDYDADGSEELLLLGFGGEPVLLENREAGYERVDAGFDVELAVPIGASAADYTGNGCLDVFVIQNGDWSEHRPDGLHDYDVAHGEDNGNPNYLFENDCSSFSLATDAGISGDHWSLATSFVDLDGDGLPDIHVANDFNHDAVYYNRGDGTFERVQLGDETNRNGMSSALGDVTGNGHPDVFVTNIWFPELVWDRMDEYTMDFRAHGNNLLLNEGNRTFTEAGAEYGVHVGGWGWAAVLADLDNDGRLDAFHTTRHYQFDFADRRFSRAEIDAIHEHHPIFSYPGVWEGGDEGFTPLSAEATGFAVADGRGVAEFDADGDGRLDLLVANNDGRFRLYENRADAGNAVAVDLARNGTVPAIGARVVVEADGETYHRFVDSNADYLAQGSRRVHVGVGDAESVSVTVTWPDGTSTVHEDLPVGGTYVLDPSGSIDERP